MKILQITKQTITMMISLAFICLGVGIFLVDDKTSFVFGLSYGVIFSILRVILLEKTINKAISMDSKKAQNYMRLHYVFRYFLSFAILIVAGLRQDILNLYAVVIGFLLLRPATYLVSSKNGMLQKRRGKKV